MAISPTSAADPATTTVELLLATSALVLWVSGHPDHYRPGHVVYGPLSASGAVVNALPALPSAPATSDGLVAGDAAPTTSVLSAASTSPATSLFRGYHPGSSIVDSCGPGTLLGRHCGRTYPVLSTPSCHSVSAPPQPRTGCSDRD